MVAGLVAVGRRASPRDPSAATMARSPVPTPTTVAATIAPATGRSDLTAYTGAGTWVDAFDFSPAHSKTGAPTVTPADVDAMAAAGVRTLYIQSARPADPLAPGDLVEPGLLGQFLARAHGRGMRVVAWYLPQLSDLDADLRHVSASLEFSAGGHRFDGFGLDIEWRAGVPDPATRSARLVELSRRIRAVAGERPVSAIVLPPVLTEVVNPAYWPGFPWTGIAPFYDAWLPMGYWTDRTRASGYRDPVLSTVDNLRRLRGHVGDVPIHVIGGIGDTASAADYEAFARVCAEQGLLGCSVYDWDTSGAAPFAGLRG